jgi:hypothetical protein
MLRPSRVARRCDVDTASQRVLDALSCEESVSAALITGFPGTCNLVEGTAFAGVDSNSVMLSLIRPIPALRARALPFA